MMLDHEIVQMKMSDAGQCCVARLQEVIAEFELSATDAATVASEIFAWAHILGLMLLGKERMLAQMDRSFVSSRAWADANFASFQARAAVVEAFDHGESGGRMQ